MEFITELAERLIYDLGMVADTWIVEWSKKLTEEIEKVEDQETKERLREYKEDLRAIALEIHGLLSKLSFDEKIDPEVAQRLRAFLSVGKVR